MRQKILMKRYFMIEKAKVIKIDVDKNQELADALRIKGLPTLMIYKEGQMIWRQSGELDANTIIGIVQEQFGS